MKKVGKNKFLSMFSIMVTMFCIIVAMFTFVFAYVPTLKFSASVTQTLSSTLYLQHNNITLFSTDSSQNVTTASVGAGKTYQVQPVGTDLVEVKGEYQSFIKNSNNEIVFSINNNANATNNYKMILYSSNIYGIDLTLPSAYVSSISTYSNLTISFDSVLGLESNDLITFVLKFEEISLPNGYTQLKYLEASGKQCIDTGINTLDSSTTITRFEGKVAYTREGTSTSTDRIFIAGYNDAMHNHYCEFHDNHFGICAGGSTWNVKLPSSSTLSVYVPYDISMVIEGSIRTTCSIDINGETLTASSSAYTGSQMGNFMLLPPLTNSNAYIRIYSAKVVVDDVIMRDFIPARQNSTNEVGLYDCVSNTFFGNSGTGTFGAGPTV